VQGVGDHSGIGAGVEMSLLMGAAATALGVFKIPCRNSGSSGVSPTPSWVKRASAKRSPGQAPASPSRRLTTRQPRYLGLPPHVEGGRIPPLMGRDKDPACPSAPAAFDLFPVPLGAGRAYAGASGVLSWSERQAFARLGPSLVRPMLWVRQAFLPVSARGFHHNSRSP
jgi:hypothetical protein